jgi:hypothetical protein
MGGGAEEFGCWGFFVYAGWASRAGWVLAGCAGGDGLVVLVLALDCG